MGAQKCITDMRSNRNENVPAGCEMNLITAEAQPSCCAIYDDPLRAKTLHEETGAYPEAFECLGECHQVQVHCS